MSSPSVKFPSTAWQTIRAAAKRGTPEYTAEMNRFIAAYWRPVFYFIRAKGHSLQRAEDLTQEFFLNCMERDWLAPADPQRGRFRTFLLTLLTRFLSDQDAARAPKQRTFDQQLVLVSALVGDQERKFEVPAGETPEKVFMKQWAEAVMSNVRQRLETWCHQRGHPDWYQIFSAMHFAPPDEVGATQQAIAARLRLSRDQVRYALEITNQRFSELLTAEVAEQVDRDDVEDEIREIRNLLGR